MELKSWKLNFHKIRENQKNPIDHLLLSHFQPQKPNNKTKHPHSKLKLKHTSITMNNNKLEKFTILKPIENSQNENSNPQKIHNTQTNHGSNQIWLMSHIHNHDHH